MRESLNTIFRALRAQVFEYHFSARCALRARIFEYKFSGSWAIWGSGDGSGGRSGGDGGGDGDAPAPEAWKPEKYGWQGRKVAHKFDCGWAVGTYSQLYTGSDKKCKGLHKVRYPDGYDGYHELGASTYGMAGMWVIVKEVPTVPG